MPQLLFTPGKDLVPLVQEAGWAPAGFDPWTIQPIASRYTNYATRPTIQEVPLVYFINHAHVYLFSCILYCA